MPKKAKEKTALAVSKIKRPGMHFVGAVSGLALQVLPTGGRTWILRVQVGDRRRDMGLGGYPDVPLAEAREAARRARARIRAGVDPIDEARAARSALKASAARQSSFKAEAESYIADNEAGWKNEKHRAQWRSSLEQYAYPKIGALLVQDIQTTHVLDILKPLWRKKTETASRLRGRIELILDAAKAQGRIPDPWTNPARWRGHLDKLLPKRSKVAAIKHYAALPFDQMGTFMPKLRAVDGMGARALEFAILTAARSGEVRGAAWSEIDLDAKTWVIPGERMKAGREHRVPLSRAAVTLLKSLPRMAGADLVFPAPRGGMLSDMTLGAVMRRMDVGAVPHGFRSTFRDWAAERTAYPNEMAEMALAHAVGDKVEAAYRRGDLFEKRRRMMDDWSAFIAKQDAGGKVVSIGRARKAAG
jgi:integrase